MGGWSKERQESGWTRGRRKPQWASRTTPRPLGVIPRALGHHWQIWKQRVDPNWIGILRSPLGPPLQRKDCGTQVGCPAPQHGWALLSSLGVRPRAHGEDWGQGGTGWAVVPWVSWAGWRGLKAEGMSRSMTWELKKSFVTWILLQSSTQLTFNSLGASCLGHL